MIDLETRDLKEVKGEYCSNISDDTLKLIASNHKALESFHLGLDILERITRDTNRKLLGVFPNYKTWTLLKKSVNGVATYMSARIAQT